MADRPGRGKEDRLTDSKQSVALVQQVNVQAPQYQQQKLLARTAIADPVGPSSGSGTIYTVPTSGTVEVNAVGLGPRAKILTIYANGGTVGCSLYHVAAGGSASANNKIGTGCSFAMDDYVFEVNIMMEAGESLYVDTVGVTGGATAYFYVIGIEYF